MSQSTEPQPQSESQPERQPEPQPQPEPSRLRRAFLTVVRRTGEALLKAVAAEAVQEVLDVITHHLR